MKGEKEKFQQFFSYNIWEYPVRGQIFLYSRSGPATFFIAGAGTQSVPGEPIGPPGEKAQICAFSPALTTHRGRTRKKALAEPELFCVRQAEPAKINRYAPV